MPYTRIVIQTDTRWCVRPGVAASGARVPHGSPGGGRRCAGRGHRGGLAPAVCGGRPARTRAAAGARPSAAGRGGAHGGRVCRAACAAVGEAVLSGENLLRLCHSFPGGGLRVLCHIHLFLVVVGLTPALGRWSGTATSALFEWYSALQ